MSYEVEKNDITPIENNKKEEERKVYISKDGFVKVPVRRGIIEISPLYNLLYPAYREKAYICGGYIRYCCSLLPNPYPASDVDIYCTNKEVFKEIEFKLLQYLSIKSDNDIAILFHHPASNENPFRFCPPIQLIKPNIIGKIVAKFEEGDIKTILSNFDFTVIRGALLNKEEALVDADFEHDDEKQILRIKNIHCPISSTMRICKYRLKGYYAPPIEILRLFLDWEERPEDYREKLHSYLISANEGKGLSKEEVDDLESLLRID